MTRLRREVGMLSLFARWELRSEPTEKGYRDEALIVVHG